jgi:hypothetical protein
MGSGQLSEVMSTVSKCVTTRFTQWLYLTEDIIRQRPCAAFVPEGRDRVAVDCFVLDRSTVG